MKQKTKILLASFATIFGALASNHANVFAEETLTSSDLSPVKSCLESSGTDICELDADYVPTADFSITVIAGRTKVLDLNGHRLGSGSYLTITNNGDLTIQDSASSGSMYGSVATRNQLTVKSGMIYSTISGSGNTSNITIIGGTLRGDITNEAEGGKVDIRGGTFGQSNASVVGDIASISGTTPFLISGGTFLGPVTFAGIGNVVSGGTFSGTFNPVSAAEVTTEISGGVFNTNPSTGRFPSGSVLTISGGTFKKGFTISVETLNITGGTFVNAPNQSDGWLILDYRRSGSQKYSVTGGTFENTGGEYGTLMAIFTSKKPTKDLLNPIFAGGDILKTMKIKLDETSTSSPYISQVVKRSPDDVDDEEPSDTGDKSDSEDDEDIMDDTDDADVKVPDTGHNTINGDNMGSTPVAVIIASVLAGSLVLSAALYFGFHKRVSF